MSKVVLRCAARISIGAALMAGCSGGAPAFDERVPGTIAFTSVPSSGPVCVSVVEAAGGERPRRLGCDRGYIGALRWDDEGFVRVALQTDERGEEEAVIDPASGEVVRREPGIGIGASRARQDGAMLFPRVEGDRSQVVAALPDGTEQIVMSAEGTQGFRTAIWSPDGQWVAAVDDERRLLIAPVTGGEARVVARDVNEAAWHQS